MTTITPVKAYLIWINMGFTSYLTVLPSTTVSMEAAVDQPTPTIEVLLVAEGGDFKEAERKIMSIVRVIRNEKFAPY